MLANFGLFLKDCESLGVPGMNLGSMSGIQQQLAALSRKMEALASCFAEEAAKATARKGRDGSEWNLRMSCLQSVQRALDERSSNNTVGDETGEDQQVMFCNQGRVESQLWTGGLMRNRSSRTKQKATFDQQGLVERPILCGNRLVEIHGTGSA